MAPVDVEVAPFLVLDHVMYPNGTESSDVPNEAATLSLTSGHLSFDNKLHLASMSSSLLTLTINY